MTIFYDFDGTLTTNIFPIYPIVEKCGIPLNDFYNEVLKEDNIYLSVCQVFSKILKSHNYAINSQNISYGVDKISLNPGVKEFLSYLNKKHVDNIVLTSGFQEFVKNTSIAKCFKNIIGTELDQEGIPTFMVSDETKSDIIKEYITNNNLNGKDIVYIGDGFTDRFAFEYVTSIGGTSILVYDSKNEKDNQIRNKFTQSNIISASFLKNFSKESDLFKYMNSLICKEVK